MMVFLKMEACSKSQYKSRRPVIKHVYQGENEFSQRMEYFITFAAEKIKKININTDALDADYFGACIV